MERASRLDIWPAGKTFSASIDQALAAAFDGEFGGRIIPADRAHQPLRLVVDLADWPLSRLDENDVMVYHIIHMHSPHVAAQEVTEQPKGKRSVLFFKTNRYPVGEADELTT